MRKSEEKFRTKLQKLLTQPANDVTTIADIEEKYLNMEKLSSQEFRAFQNYERYRIRKLRHSNEHKKFVKNYARLRALSNIADYTEFLKPRYDIKP